MSLKTRLRAAVRRAGYDLVRYPPKPVKPKWPKAPPAPAAPAEEPPAPPVGVPAGSLPDLARVVAVMHRLGVDRVLDVGANRGQYARGIRFLGYGGAIQSFEPVASAFDTAREYAATDADAAWELRKLAVGSAPGTARINVAANSAQSSSLLPMLERHEQAAPHARYVDTEEVEVARLDDVVPFVAGDARTFLKIDTQGFESEVIAGALAHLGSDVAAVQVELSLVPLYEGGPLYRDVADTLGAHGFRLALVLPGYCDPHNGEMLQFDGVFVKDATAR